jgi:F-type H+-transporting ATPase subunit delta
MSAATVPGVYASALLAVARERGVVDAVVEASRELAPALTPALLRGLDNPRVGKVKAKQALNESLSAAPREVRELLLLLVDRNRLADAPAILAEVTKQHERDVGVVHVKLTTAVVIDNALRDRLVDRIKNNQGARAVLDQTVDGSLIGGFTARIGDNYLDASVKRSLADLRKSIEAVPLSDALWSKDPA